MSGHKMNSREAITLGLQLGQDLSRYPRPVRDAIVIHLQDVAKREDAAKKPKLVKKEGVQ